MKSLFFLLISALFLSGCTIRSSSKADKNQMELSLHKVRTEVDEIKHDLNTYEIEHHILEGKLIDQEQTISNLKQQVSDLKLGKLESFMQELQAMDKKIGAITKRQDKILSDIRQLSSHANDTTTALSQYKEKIAQFERAISLQNEQLKDIAKIREQLVQMADSEKLYTVKAGDSLEKIARAQNTTVEEIKKINHLTTDLIVVGQEIRLP